MLPIRRRRQARRALLVERDDVAQMAASRLRAGAAPGRGRGLLPQPDLAGAERVRAVAHGRRAAALPLDVTVSYDEGARWLDGGDRSTAWRCRRRSSPGSASTSSTHYRPRAARSASSRARSCIRRTASSDGARSKEDFLGRWSRLKQRARPPPSKPAPQDEAAQRRAAGAAAGRGAHARFGLPRLLASQGGRRAAPRGAEEAVQRSALQHARIRLERLLRRLDRREPISDGDAGDAEPGAHACSSPTRRRQAQATEEATASASLRRARTPSQPAANRTDEPGRQDA